MDYKLATVSASLQTSSRFRSAKKELIATILEASSKINEVKAGSTHPELRENYLKAIQEFSRDRGRELYFPFLASGIGRGPFIELMDGSVKFDMVTGIGVNFFGHTYPEFLDEMISGLSADVMQGNLEPGVEMRDLLRTILSKVGKGCRLKHGWIMCSGTMVNEIALKIIRQKKEPATRILAFKNCFAGRSTAMQEITDNPSYRQGQPNYGEVDYLPFYDPKVGLSDNIDAALSTMRKILSHAPDQFAALMVELVQGEGGFSFAPRDFYVRIFEEAKKHNLTIWADEIQTFGRTGELFAFQKFSLNEYVDVVTIGKMLQACLVLFAEDYNPKPGLVAGTFSGSTAALRTARRVIELLTEEGFLGKEGKIEKLSNRFSQALEKLASDKCKGMIQEIRVIGGMIAFSPFSGSLTDVKAVLMQLYDDGVVAFSCGHGPYFVRLLPPLGIMQEAEVDRVCFLIGCALQKISKAAL